VLPCLIFEDDHLLVVNKPAGMNTHAPSPFAGVGIYDWLRHREPRWSSLAIIHRLDKETSGLILFSKTPLGNRVLTKQFAEREVRKKYVFVTDCSVPENELIVKSKIARAGDKYVSRRAGPGGQVAETRFRSVAPSGQLPESLGAHQGQRVEAFPLTGRTHQIRVQAADNGFPILGDTLYGGATARRLFLHATELTISHPATGEPITFTSPPDFAADARLALRFALIDAEETNACRLCHGASDGWPGWYVDRLGDYLLSQSEGQPRQEQLDEIARLMKRTAARGASHKVLSRRAGQKAVDASPQPVLGDSPPARFSIRENGLQFELSFAEGYSVGLFLDQRDNRRRLFANYVAPGFPVFAPSQNKEPRTVLNTFAYTCGFSVCAAKAGARTMSLDLSKKYLDWGKRNFELNGLSPGEHDFLFGDVFDWLRRLARKERTYDLILLDPPTFSQSKQSGTFQVEKDYGKLVSLALPLLRPGGVLFASANVAGWEPEKFLSAVEAAIRSGGRAMVQRHYAPQPPDFPISRNEPAYLKTVWLRID
jgi:23S rRNA (cytosine1962-C5)-methyltransferase